MNQAEQLIYEIKSLGVEMKLQGNNLQLVGPKGVVNQSHKERLKEVKTEIIKILSKPSARVYTIGTKDKGTIKYHSMIDRSGDSIEQVKQSLSEQFGERFVSVELK